VEEELIAVMIREHLTACFFSYGAERTEEVIKLALKTMPELQRRYVEEYKKIFEEWKAKKVNQIDTLEVELNLQKIKEL
jgi:hypothetical protein